MTEANQRPVSMDYLAQQFEPLTLTNLVLVEGVKQEPIQDFAPSSRNDKNL